jgi:hypothetical protein
MAPGESRQLIVNGDCESYDGWVFVSTQYMSGYSETRSRSVTRSLRTGIEVGGWNPPYGTHSVVEQSVLVPAEATGLALKLWYYAVATSGPADADWDTVLAIRDEGGTVHQLLHLSYPQINQGAWVKATWATGALAAFKGQHVTLQIETYNDGWDGSAALYVDDVSFVASR